MTMNEKKALTQEQISDLLKAAADAADKNSCCRHSSFTVGAALLDREGGIRTGINIENHGIQSICAERVVLCNALSSGLGSEDFVALAVVGRNLSDTEFSKTLPCGYCRQFLSEYASPDMPVYTIGGEYTVRGLLPESFSH